MASLLVISLVVVFDLIAFGLAIAAEQRRSTVLSFSLPLSLSTYKEPFFLPFFPLMMILFVLVFLGDCDTR